MTWISNPPVERPADDGNPVRGLQNRVEELERELGELRATVNARLIHLGGELHDFVEVLAGISADLDAASAVVQPVASAPEAPEGADDVEDADDAADVADSDESDDADGSEEAEADPSESEEASGVTGAAPAPGAEVGDASAPVDAAVAEADDTDLLIDGLDLSEPPETAAEQGVPDTAAEAPPMVDSEVDAEAGSDAEAALDAGTDLDAEADAGDDDTEEEGSESEPTIESTDAPRPAEPETEPEPEPEAAQPTVADDATKSDQAGRVVNSAFVPSSDGANDIDEILRREFAEYSEPAPAAPIRTAIAAEPAPVEGGVAVDAGSRPQGEGDDDFFSNP